MPTDKWEKAHRANIKKGIAKVNAELRANANRIAEKIRVLQSKQSLTAKRYGDVILKNKQLLKGISEEFFKMEGNINETLAGLTKYSWDLANKKNDADLLIYKSLESKFIGKDWRNPNIEAYNAFMKRNIDGLNLSQRIHIYTEQNKALYLDYIGTGITQGKSAAQIARGLNKINNDPANATILDKDGNPTKLGLKSKLLVEGAQGHGIYKSPLKNLLRVTRNETNVAYRISDFERRQDLDFVVGIKVHLSNAHVVPDMCFTQWNYKISTSKGLKYIKDIEVGDLVLTHKGRFRKVKKLYRSTVYEVDKTELKYSFPYDDKANPKIISATSNHPFLINSGWKKLSDATVGDTIRILATRCKTCDKKIPYFRNYCSRSCSSKNTAVNQWKSESHRKGVTDKRNKLIADNDGIIPFFKDWINSKGNIKNLINPDFVKKRIANQKATCEAKVKAGTHQFQCEENRRKSVQAMGNSNKRSYIEKKMQWLLGELNIKNEPQTIIYRNVCKKNGQRRYYKPDFLLTKYKVIVECDGDYWHSKTVDADLIRQKELEGLGFTVLRFKGSEIRNNLKEVSKEIQRVVYNHEDKYEFIEYPISGVRHYTQKQITPITKYNFEVEEDNSYIANGVVVHNCDSLQGTYPKDFKFYNWHIQCMCYTTSILATLDEMNAYFKTDKMVSKNLVKDIPKNATDWVKKTGAKAKKFDFVKNDNRLLNFAKD